VKEESKVPKKTNDVEMGEIAETSASVKKEENTADLAIKKEAEETAASDKAAQVLKRKERLRLWKEQQAKKVEDDIAVDDHSIKAEVKIEVEKQPSATEVVSEKVAAFGFAKPTPKPPSQKAAGLGKFNFSKKKLVISSKNKPKVRKPAMDISKAFSALDDKDDDMVGTNKDASDDVDPLDAFMTGIDDETKDDDAGDDLEVFSASLPERPAVCNVITMEEIFGKADDDDVQVEEGDWEMDDDDGTKSPIRQNRPYGGITPGRNEQEETDEAREAREQRERQEFLDALKGQREAEQEAEKKRLETVKEVERKRLEDEAKKPKKKKMELGIFYAEDDRVPEEDDLLEEEKSALEKLEDLQTKKQVAEVDHSKIDYMPFRKRFYIVPREIANMKESEVQKLRTELEIKTRGQACPRPVSTWLHCGLGDRINAVVARQNFAAPFPIQRQALPAIMSGRDVIGIAKTGSGKTLAFVLPMIRHILDQDPLEKGESGPIGLIMAPARELCLQIYNEVRKFAKPLGLTATAVYGGAGVSEQIGALKRGSDIVVCTPGRMIDILTMNAGKLISLARVTYVVMDEADRMFDMGFEPQIGAILKNVRPDRQLVLFSATFPTQVEALARKVLAAPIEVTVGLRSVASGDITQYVEVRDEEDKFPRLLQLLGLWCERGNILIFADSQQHVDVIFKDLMRSGYPCLCLHGGMEQADRDYTIDDFKRKIRTVMVATSVAGRGLDVADLVLVVNYHCPNHLEDYVHRVGRTGRAGRKGTAYTFIAPEEEAYAPEIAKALEQGKQPIPEELTKLAAGFKEKVKLGQARKASTGFSGTGFKFDDSEKSEAQKLADMQKKHFEIEQGIRSVDEIMPNSEAAADSAKKDPFVTPGQAMGNISDAVRKATAAANKQGLGIATNKSKAFLAATALAARITFGIPKEVPMQRSDTGEPGSCSDIIEINDYPQKARWKVMGKDTKDRVEEEYTVAITARGHFFDKGRNPGPGEEKLHFVIDGDTVERVSGAKRELRRILEEATLELHGRIAAGLDGGGGKYNVV